MSGPKKTSNKVSNMINKSRTPEEIRQRVRDNQRRSRQRRNEYVEEMEEILQKAKKEGIQPDPVFQECSRRILNDNEALISESDKLRAILTEDLGLTMEQVEGELRKIGAPPLKDWRSERDSVMRPLASILPTVCFGYDNSSATSSRTTPIVDGEIERRSNPLDPGSSKERFQSPPLPITRVVEENLRQIVPAEAILSSESYTTQDPFPSMTLGYHPLGQFVSSNGNHPNRSFVYNPQGLSHLQQPQINYNSQALKFGHPHQRQIDHGFSTDMQPHVGTSNHQQLSSELGHQQQADFVFYNQ